MLAPNSRLLLLDALKPPPGFRVDSAVATTYTLSLDALLIPPAAWALHAAGNRLETVDPILLANSLRHFGDRTIVFHQAGVASPFAVGDEELSAFLDGMVVPVRVGPGETFHPKVWVLRFISEDGEIGLRVLIGSRNLSLESTWDVLVAMDSVPPAEGTASGRPLAELLESLPNRSTIRMTTESQRLLEVVTTELAAAHFAPPPGFTSAEIMWLRRYQVSTPFPTSCRRRLVISPFLGASCLGALPMPTDPDASILVSRAASLTPDLATGFTAYTLSTDVGAVEDGSEARIGQELHAKLFAFDGPRDSTLIVGSANATVAAFSLNDEIVVRFTGPTATVGVRALLGESELNSAATDDLELIDLLQPWFPDDASAADEQDDGRFFDEAIRSVASVPLRGECVPVSDDRWRISLRLTEPVSVPIGIGVDVRLLTQSTSFPADALLRGDSVDVVVPLDGVSRFVVARLSDLTGQAEAVSVVLVVDMDVPDGRGRRVIRSLLTNREKFARFLRYLLEGIEGDQSWGGGDVVDGIPHQRRSSRRQVLAEGPILEQLLRLLAVRPSELRFLDEAIADFADEADVLPDGFRELWSAISPLIPEVQR